MPGLGKSGTPRINFFNSSLLNAFFWASCITMLLQCGKFSYRLAAVTRTLQLRRRERREDLHAVWREERTVARACLGPGLRRSRRNGCEPTPQHSVAGQRSPRTSGSRLLAPDHELDTFWLRLLCSLTP